MIDNNNLHIEYYKMSSEMNFNVKLFNYIHNELNTENNKFYKNATYIIKSIKKICNIKVDVYIDISYYPENPHSKFHSYLIIRHSMITDEGGNFIRLYNKNLSSLNDISEFNVEYIDTLINMIKVIIRNLKFNKYTNEFYDDSDIKYINERNIFDEFKNDEQCCVCLDKMICQTTTCGHCLCIECWDKLKKNQCPICRTKEPDYKVNDTFDDCSDDDDDEN